MCHRESGKPRRGWKKGAWTMAMDCMAQTAIRPISLIWAVGRREVLEDFDGEE